MNMERLVRDLLRLARLDAGQETIERRPVSMAGVISAGMPVLIVEDATSGRRGIQRFIHCIAPVTKKYAKIYRSGGPPDENALRQSAISHASRLRVTPQLALAYRKAAGPVRSFPHNKRPAAFGRPRSLVRVTPKRRPPESGRSGSLTF